MKIRQLTTIISQLQHKASTKNKRIKTHLLILQCSEQKKQLLNKVKISQIDLNIKTLEIKQILPFNVYTSTQIITTSFLFKRNIIEKSYKIIKIKTFILKTKRGAIILLLIKKISLQIFFNIRE